MANNPENETKKLELESKISELVKAESKCTAHFQYKKTGTDKVELIVSTLNPNHTETFILMKTTEIGTLRCLEKVLSYLEHHKKYQSPYTVLWSEKSNFRLNTSYFHAYDMEEVLNRFFEGKDKNSYIVYEMKLNPIS